MTATIVSLALLFTPAPITAPKESSWQPIAPSESWVSASPAEDISTTAYSSSPLWIDPPEIPVHSSIAESVPPPSTAPILSPIDTGLPPSPMELVDQIFGWPGAQLVTCESGWNRWAVGSFGERGLFQVHPIHRYGIVARLGYSWDDMFEVEPNIHVAAEIRRVQGLRAWTCWRG